MGSLRILFEQKLEQWKKEKNKEYERLTGKLMSWGSVVAKGETLWAAVKDQILFKAKTMGIKPEEVVEHLFEQEDAEIWMLVFQLPHG